MGEEKDKRTVAALYNKRRAERDKQLVENVLKTVETDKTAMKILLERMKSHDNIDINKTRQDWLAQKDVSYLRFSQADVLSGNIKPSGSLGMDSGRLSIPSIGS